jgi:hypothetical protein
VLNPIPLLGQLTAENQDDLVQYAGRLAQESKRAGREWEQFVELCNNNYAYGDDEAPALDQMVLHEIQCAVIATVTVQMQEPPRAKLEPVETGEPPIFYWAGGPLAGAALGLPPECVQAYPDPITGQIKPPEPIPFEFGEELHAVAIPKEQYFAQKQAQAMVTQQAAQEAQAPGALAPAPAPVMPQLIREDHIVALDDRLVADIYQAVFEVIWRRSNVDQFVWKNCLDTNIQGWSFGLFEFDEREEKIVLRHLPIKQVYVDPTAHHIKDAAYAGFDMPLDADEAKAIYPSLADAIDRMKHTGRPTQFSAGGMTTEFSQQFEQDFEREMVTLRVFWLRHQIVPMSEREAVESGEVLTSEAVDGPVLGPGNGGAATDAGAIGIADDAGSSWATDGVTPPGDEAADGLGGPGAGDLEAGLRREGSGQVLPPVPEQTRLAYFLADTGAEVAPGGPGWPTKRGIRQVTMLCGADAGEVVDDRESGFWDIPILHNINIPLPGARPWGIGEPYRLRNLQRALSRTVNSMVDHVDFNAHPVRIMTSETVALLPESVRRSGHAEPGMIVELPISTQEFVTMGGKLSTVEAPPPMSPAHESIVPMLTNFVERQSGYNSAMRGTVPSANASGKMVELLQDSNAMIMAHRGRSTGVMVEWLANLALHEIVNGMTPEDVFKIYSKLPIHVLRAACERARSMEWNIAVTVQAGAAGMQAAKRAEATELYGAGLITKETAREKVPGVDQRQEKQREKRELLEMAQLAAQQPQQEQGDGRDKGRPAA